MTKCDVCEKDSFRLYKYYIFNGVQDVIRRVCMDCIENMRYKRD